MNDIEFFLLYVSKTDYALEKFSPDEYVYCTSCRICQIRSECDEMYGINNPTIKQEDLNIIKEKYPEYFL